MKLYDQFVSEGAGLYSIPETARYARTSKQTVSRWMFGNQAGTRVLAAPANDQKFISFVDFVQVLAVRNLRAHYGVSLQKIRDAVSAAEERFGIRHPLARKHTIFHCDRNIWIKVEGDIYEAKGQDLQSGFTKVLEEFLEDVSFDPETGLANRFQAFASSGQKIIMDPRVRFGEPILEGAGYTPEALYEAAKTEGSLEQAAKVYGVPESMVKAAVDYFDSLAA